MVVKVGDVTLRAEHVSKIVTGFALQAYTMKQLCAIDSSNSWQETYFQETAADLTGGTGSAVKGIPRLANFPHGNVTWKEKTGRHKKHGMEGTISWEDAATDDIDVVVRTMLRVGRAVAKSVDENIWNTLTENQTANLINSVSITAGSEWDSNTIANRDPIQDILNAIKEISVDNYNALGGNGKLLLSPKDYANLLGNANIRNAGQFYTSDVTKNGRVGRLLGLDVIVSNSITADYAAVVIAKEAATWKQAAPLTVKAIDAPGINWILRAWEVGQCQLKNPEAVCLIDNTQK